MEMMLRIGNRQLRLRVNFDAQPVIDVITVIGPIFTATNFLSAEPLTFAPIVDSLLQVIYCSKIIIGV